jgi:hypothetical protein
MNAGAIHREEKMGLKWRGDLVGVSIVPFACGEA